MPFVILSFHIHIFHKILDISQNNQEFKLETKKWTKNNFEEQKIWFRLCPLEDLDRSLIQIICTNID